MAELHEDTMCLNPSVLMRSFRKDKIVQMYIETKTELFKEREQSLAREKYHLEKKTEVENKLGGIQKDYDEDIESLRCLVAESKRLLVAEQKKTVVLGGLLLAAIASAFLYIAVNVAF
jgi:hypothetical protein